MDAFIQAVSDVDKKCKALLASHKYCMDALLKEEIPSKGVYVLSEGDDVLYVGRTNRLRKRLQDHTRNSHYQATFAFLLAREQTGKKATYKREGSRAELLKDSAFGPVFTGALKRVAKMKVQFIEEDDPVRQALLEICVAVRKEAKYSNFDNH